jgi:trehalose 6-phosphate phosphatase
MTRLLQAVPPGLPLAVFLDYDGTLVAIRRRPDLARLGPDRRAELGRLGRTAFVGIVSGRPLAEVRRMVGLRGLAYLGNHGMEIRAKGRTWVQPDAARKARSVGRAARAVAVRTRGIPGVLVEDKGLTASVHYRTVAARHHARLRAIVADEVRRSRGGLVLTQGKKVFEIRPNVPWDKGRGVLALLRRERGLRSSFPVYIGDDRTDEDAFRALRGRGLTVRVGSGGLTLARYRLRGVGDVWKFLAALRVRAASR